MQVVFSMVIYIVCTVNDGPNSDPRFFYTNVFIKSKFPKTTCGPCILEWLLEKFIRDFGKTFSLDPGKLRGSKSKRLPRIVCGTEGAGICQKMAAIITTYGTPSRSPLLGRKPSIPPTFIPSSNRFYSATTKLCCALSPSRRRGIGSHRLTAPASAEVGLEERKYTANNSCFVAATMP